MMKHLLPLLAASLVLTAGVTIAQDKKLPPLKTALGTVKTVAADAVTVTDKDGKEWAFTVDATTKIIVKGGSHKTAGAKETGQTVSVTDLLRDGQRVRIRYSEMEGKMRAAEIRVI